MPGGKQHALLWNGTAASAVDLHPSSGSGYFSTSILGMSETLQVGTGSITGNLSHALKWTGTASSMVDLNPTGYEVSQATAVSGNSVVGWARVSAATQSNHAMLWLGAAANNVDLNPTGYTFSQAEGVSSAGQVGYGKGSATGNNEHALLWDGTASSVIDLHSYLSGLGPTFIQSQARAIADNGSIVGYATVTGSDFYAVLWTPAPASGDFNNDHSVDAADYVTWRKMGADTGYNLVRQHFGESLPLSGTTLEAFVPEASSFFLLGISAISLLGYRKRTV